jgi:NADPH:quinone reductase-like Zn-dependent oxidoreductase
LGEKVIDRKAHSPVHEFLTATYASSPFSAIIDAVGVQEIYDHSPSYSSPNAPFVSVGVMSADLRFTTVLGSILQIGSNLYRPRLLGGVSRPYIQKTANVDKESLEKLRVLVEGGQLKVVVDECFSFQNAIQVTYVSCLICRSFI